MCLLLLLYLQELVALCSLLWPSFRCFTAKPFPFQGNSNAITHFPFNRWAIHRLLCECVTEPCVCATLRSVCYQVEVSKASFQPFPSQIVTKPHLVISPFSPSSFHSSALCYVVSTDTPFLSRGSWLLVMLLRKSLPPDSYKSFDTELLASFSNHILHVCGW